MNRLAVPFLLVMFALVVPLQAGVDPLQPFAPGNSQGGNPLGDLIGDGAYFYGMTSRLGQFNGGTVFRISGDGNEFQVLHAFAGGSADGAHPGGSLVVSGMILYGMTMSGGDGGRGTIFRMQTDGSGYALLHKFAGGAADGKNPHGSLVLSGTVLYGMTYEGGSGDMGTVFRMRTDGSGYGLLHKFAGGTSDGAHPGGSLVVSGMILYGMTMEGGYADVGAVFKMGVDGSGFSLLHEFADFDFDGGWPEGSLLLSGTTLYGMTSNLAGAIFKLRTDGSGFTLLHKFVGEYGDGAEPFGNLIIYGETLYGMTSSGGIGSGSEYGTVFKMETDGSGFTLLHAFAGGEADGESPRGSLIVAAAALYGMTWAGGKHDGGTLFRIDTNGRGFALLYSFAGGAPSGKDPYGSAILSDSMLNGMNDMDRAADTAHALEKKM
jgi:uncharacterized repeat protein (TIGR03803 family)